MMTKRIRFTVMIAVIATFIGCSSDDNGVNQDPTKGSITGTVSITLEDESSVGLQGATVGIFAADTLNTTTTTNANGEYTVTDLSPGTYVIGVAAEGYNDAVEENVSVTAGATATVDFELIALTGPANAIRINSGGPALDADGVEWAADNSFENGATFSDDIDIANTTNPELYQTERYASAASLTYEIPVENGTYSVNLHFAEIFFGVPGAGSAGGEGSRVFHIDIEGGLAQVNDYDIVVAAGGSATAVEESFTDILVEDGSLTIVLTSVVENAKISGIEVLFP